MLGDIILAEPGALIGFAGPRVIEQTIRKKLPPGFQKAEVLLEHGLVDLIVPRTQQRQAIGSLLKPPRKVTAPRAPVTNDFGPGQRPRHPDYPWGDTALDA